MLKRFFPNEYLDSIRDIDFESLKRKGIVSLIFDIDNTIAPFDVPEPDDDIIYFFANLTKMGFNICFLSNNNKDRVMLFNEKLKLHAVFKAGKPKLRGINSALELLGTGCECTVLVGDQVFTDIWCGNRRGLYTILVKPIANRDEFTVRLKRGIERLVVNYYLKKRDLL